MKRLNPLTGIAFALAITVAWGLTGGCGQPPEPTSKPRVLTSFLPVYCFATAVAGDAAQVENLLPEHVGPHDYLLTPRDLRRIAQADLIVVNGLGLEDDLVSRMKSAVGDRLPPLVVASSGLDDELIRSSTGVAGWQEDSHRHRGTNSHIWLDPRLAAHSVTNILKGLQQIHPEAAVRYASNAAAFVERLHQLDAELEEELKPVREAPFVTYHDAFSYFVRRYQLRLIGVVEPVPDINPSPRYLQALYRAVREEGAKVIFTEPQFSTRLVREMARDLGVTTAELDPLETGPLHSGAYEEGMRRNLQTLREQLE